MFNTQYLARKHRERRVGALQGMGVYLKTGFAEESVGVGIRRLNAAHSKPDA